MTINITFDDVEKLNNLGTPITTKSALMKN
jgi:hypothetical protein